MIDSTKTGKFILALRNEKKLSQEQLGKIIGIGRDSISKWERGVSLPSYEMLLALSEEFNVSVKEILLGEKLNKENDKPKNEITSSLYNKVKKVIKSLCIITLILISIFGIYYFINFYKSVVVYTVSGIGENSFIKDSIFIKTKGKIYFSINEIETEKDYSIKRITLYYKNLDNLIYSGDDANILLIEEYGYDEYFKTEYFNDIEKNLYLCIEYTNGDSETIKLNLIQDYINDELFFKKEESIATTKHNNDIEFVPADLKYLIKGIEKKFEKLENGWYKYAQKIDDTYYYITYIPNSGTIVFDKENDKGLLEEWHLTTLHKLIIYNAYDNNEVYNQFNYENGKIKCEIGSCKNAEEKVEYFWNYLYNLI